MARRHFGQVRKMPSGRFQASFMHQGRRILAPSTFGTKADANVWLDNQSTDLARGAWIDPRAGRITFAQYAERWLAGWPGLGELTTGVYRYVLDLHILPTFGPVALADISPTSVREWFTPLSARIPNAAAKAYRLLSLILKTAVNDDLLLKNPCTVKGASVEPHSERPVITVEELDIMVEGSNEHIRPLFLLAAWCQLRRAEILGLRRMDIDLLHGTLSVQETRTQTMKRKEVVKEPKSRAGVRVLAIPPNIVPVLAAHLERHVGPEPTSRLLVGVDGVPLPYRAVDYHVRKARNEINRPDVHLHDLRHSGLTWAAATGATTAELMKRGGHANPQAALRYQHATVDRDRAMAEALAKMAEVVPMPRKGRATPKSPPVNADEKAL